MKDAEGHLLVNKEKNKLDDMDTNDKCTQQDYNDIIESLQHTLKAKDEYEKYPSYEYKTKTMAETQALLQKLKSLRKQ